EVFVVRARRRAAASPHGAPVPALQDRAIAGRVHAPRPLVDVAGHVVHAERALAPGTRSRGLRLPQPIELLLRRAAVSGLERALLDRAPAAVHHAGRRVAREPVRVRAHLLPFGREAPLVLVAEPLSVLLAERLGLAERDDDHRVLA